KQLLQKGFYVYLGCRDLAKGLDAVMQLKSEGYAQVEAISLDVSSDLSVKNASEEISKKTHVLDVLINNAGINGGMPYAALEASPDQFMAAFDTHDIGVARGLDAVMQLKSEGYAQVEAISLDVSSDLSVKNASEEISKKTHVLDVLINNAGINGGMPYAALEASPDQFMAAFDTNVIGVA